MTTKAFWPAEPSVLSISTPPHQAATDAVVIGMDPSGRLGASATLLDQACGGTLSRLIEAGEIRGKSLELTPLYGLANVTAPLVLVVGLGDSAELDRGVAFRAAATASRHLASRERKRVAFFLDLSATELVEHAIAGALVGCQGPDLYRREKNRFPFSEVHWQSHHQASIDAGKILGNSVNLTRRLVNEPPQELYPETFAEFCVDVAQRRGLEIEVWDEARLTTERCESLLAVARGSVRPPRMVILRYRGNPQDKRNLAFVGKGVTFDSGGLSIKTSDSMQDMKCDMAGAATVLGAINAIAQLKLPINVSAFLGLVENMPGGASYKLGDVLKTRQGTTIEVLNTDAEGRLVLADVLNVAVEQGASHLIDLATLTGACMVALGTDVTGAMSNSADWCDEILLAAQECCERVWQLPMYPEYGELIRSEVADIKNIGGRWGGAITAAKLLEVFVNNLPWTHLDIAGPAFLDKPKTWQDAGGSGALVRTLVQIARRFTKSA
ncbi:MAG: leucyl aminopeptidase [Planctomycetota bacterium]|nr:leucyl aminopeptidase [Planctomycetota bacterium]